MSRVRIFALFVAIALLAPASLPGSAKYQQVQVAVGFSIGPYVVPGGKGIIGDLIRESLQHTGAEPVFTYRSNLEAIESFKAGEVDAVTVVRKGMVDGYYSQPLVTFENYTWTLAERNIEIVSMEDLIPYRVAAFSSANRFLGQQFGELVPRLAGYHEIDDQRLQVAALLRGEVDVIISDRTIFDYYRKRLINGSPEDETWRQEVTRGFAFPASVYHIAFTDAGLRDRFDEGLIVLEHNGRREQIRQFYLGLLDNY